MRKIIIGIISIISVSGFGYCAYEYHQNNNVREWPDTSLIQGSFDKSVQWMMDNYPAIKKNHNPALWWMIKEAVDISNNGNLSDMYRQYKTGYLDRRPANLWTPFFYEYHRPVNADVMGVSGLAPYQVFLAFALSCGNSLAQTQVIQEQMEPDYCRMHYLSPRCVTHQLMAVRLMQRHDCGDVRHLAELSSALRDMIIDELTYDFRVTDSYLQRVMMLAESGNFAAIKPVWIHRILNAQNQDGGWGDLYPVMSFGNSMALGWTSRLPAYSKQQSDFHATAQGIWLMALLLRHGQNKADN